MGRPTLYRPEYCDAVMEYFQRPREAREVKVSAENREGEWKQAYRTICAELPSIAGFCIELGISRNTLYEWQKAHADFRDSCARAVLLAESLVADRGNNGLYNAQFAAFYGKNVFGWKDKTEVETVNSQDSQDMGQMKQALANATAEQLAQFSALIAAMQAQVPAVLPAAEE